MDTPIQVDLGRIAQDLQIRRVQVESVVQLLDEGNTVPFITRYRKERTGNLNEVVIREVQTRVGRLRELAERKETILKAIEAQGKLTDELRQAIQGAENPKRLEDLYLPYKPKKRTKASDARDKGLEPLALRIWNRDESLTDLAAAAAEFVDPAKELETPEKVLEGVGHILAESISELAPVREAARRVVWKTAKVVTTKAENLPEAEGLDYRDYFNYSEPVQHIPPHRVLAINRGDKEGPLKVKLDVPRPELERAVFNQLPLEGHPQAEFFTRATVDALDRLLLPSLEREVRRDLTDMAERHAVDVFARNLRSLLLQPPIPKQVVLAIDPGFRTGCKVAVLDPNGSLLAHEVVHPHPPQNRRHEAKQAIKDLVGKHHVGVVAIGNGTACRETEELIAEIIAEGTRFHHQALGLAPADATAPPEPTSEPAPAPAPEGEAQAPHEPEAAAPEPAPGEAEPAPPPAEAHHEHEHADGNGAAPSPAPDDAVEALPPISGGAPDDEQHPDPQVDQELYAPPAEAAQAAPSADLTATAEAPATAQPTEDAPPAAPELGPQAPAPVEPEPAPEPAADATPAVAAEAPEHDDGQGAGPPPTAEAAAIETMPEAAAETTPEAAGGEAPATGGVVSLSEPPRGKPRGEQGPRPQRPKQPPPPPAPHAADPQLAQLAYVIVNEAGASVYSASPVGREEFPDFDATLRSAISIGRRLQDPLAELVKIEPQNIGVGLYQHDVNPKHLKESLETVIESCVNFVGVDLNTASVPLLRHVSGLNQLTARRIVERRGEKGPFTDRAQLMEVDGVGPATFTQAAGFLKVREGDNPLDRTWVHPESYGVTAQALEKLGFTPDVVREKDRLPELHAKMNEVDVPAMSQELGVGRETLHDIFEALARPERDPRDDLPKPIFKKGVLKLEDLSAGMELKGTVLNVVDFGAFVDIGLKDSGLVHISQLANKYIKSPHDVVSVGDVVTVWVLGVDQERKRVSLTMVKPGTERPRGERGGRRPQGQGQGEGRPGGGGERRGGPPRGPRREGAPAGAGAPGGEGGGRPAEGRPGPRGPSQGGRVPGPPMRGQGGNLTQSGPRPLRGPGRPGPTPTPRPQPARPSKPSAPPPPLSKDALSGSVPLRTFGQLKQLWQAREEGPEGEAQPAEGPPPAAPANEPEPSPPPPAEATPAESSPSEPAAS